MRFVMETIENAGRKCVLGVKFYYTHRHADFSGLNYSETMKMKKRC
jgi:hypothetical protein